MNPNTPTPPTEDPLRPHSYDGIQEYDKRLPNWWLFTFYATVVFWVGYWGYYEWLHVGPSNHQQINKAMAAIEAEKLAATASTKLDNASLWEMSRNPVFVDAGKVTFNSICATCHKESMRGVADGGIGANLTTQTWIHGGNPMDLYATVTNGVLVKGMPAWGPVLGQKRIIEAVAYVLSHHHEGEPMTVQSTPAVK